MLLGHLLSGNQSIAQVLLKQAAAHAAREEGDLGSQAPAVKICHNRTAMQLVGKSCDAWAIVQFRDTAGLEAPRRRVVFLPGASTQHLGQAAQENIKICGWMTLAALAARIFQVAAHPSDKTAGPSNAS